MRDVCEDRVDELESQVEDLKRRNRMFLTLLEEMQRQRNEIEQERDWLVDTLDALNAEVYEAREEAASQGMQRRQESNDRAELAAKLESMHAYAGELESELMKMVGAGGRLAP